MSLLKDFTLKVLNPTLRKLGGELVPKSKAISLESALARLAAKKIEVASVIDVGASYGKWSEVTRRYFPGKYLLVEANETHASGLEEFKRQTPDSDFVLAAAGDKTGEVYFDASDALGGVASHDPLSGDRKKVIRVPVTTIDIEVSKRQMPGPYLVKLDTHGFELPILAGAEETLKNTSILMLETYNFSVADGALRFHEMISFLEQRGFRVIDMCDPMYRARDGVLWQMDFIFAKADRPEFQSAKWLD